jgi:hypothetical protein
MRWNYSFDDLPLRRFTDHAGNALTAGLVSGSVEIEIDRNSQWFVRKVYLTGYPKSGRPVECEIVPSDPLHGAIINELEAHYDRHIVDSFHDEMADAV